MVKDGIRGRDAIEDTIDDFCRVNRTTRDEFSRHLKSALKEWERLSGYDFRVDFGEYAGLVNDCSNSDAVTFTSYDLRAVLSLCQ